MDPRAEHSGLVVLRFDETSGFEVQVSRIAHICRTVRSLPPESEPSAVVGLGVGNFEVHLCRVVRRIEASLLNQLDAIIESARRLCEGLRARRHKAAPQSGQKVVCWPRINR